MYLRFVRPTLITGMAARQGFFSAAYELRNTPTTNEHSVHQVTNLLDWFNLNLSRPQAFTHSSSKGIYRADFTKGLSWFRPEATEVLAKSRELIALLQSHDYAIETLRSTRVGCIVYENADQIVAEPFSDTPT